MNFQVQVQKQTIQHLQHIYFLYLFDMVKMISIIYNAFFSVDFFGTFKPGWSNPTRPGFSMKNNLHQSTKPWYSFISGFFCPLESKPHGIMFQPKCGLEVWDLQWWDHVSSIHYIEGMLSHSQFNVRLVFSGLPKLPNLGWIHQRFMCVCVCFLGYVLLRMFLLGMLRNSGHYFEGPKD